MSKVNIIHYRYRVCPTCKSKKLKPVGVFKFRHDQYYTNLPEMKRTGFICDNCNRYHAYETTKFAHDRAEIRRDIKKMQKFLSGKKAGK